MSRYATPQPRVPRESLSWCISDSAAYAWEFRGDVIEKAHRAEEVEPVPGRRCHKPVCGSVARIHAVERCTPAPEGFPACRSCWAKAQTSDVPEVFRYA